MKAIIAAVTMIVIVTVVVIPVLQSAEYDNYGQNSGAEGRATETIISGAYTATANGYAIDGIEKATVSDGGVIFISDNILLLKKTAATMTLMNRATGGNYTIKDFTVNADAGTYTYIATGQTDPSEAFALGSNPIRLDSSGDLGVFKPTTGFKIDQDKKMWMYSRANNVTIGSAGYGVWAWANGTADSLTVRGIALSSSGTTSFGTATAAIATDWIGEPNDTIFSIGSGWYADIVATLDGSSGDTTTSADNTVIFAPVSFTEVTGSDEAIKSMLDSVPLLILIGAIVMVVAAIVIRR